MDEEASHNFRLHIRTKVSRPYVEESSPEAKFVELQLKNRQLERIQLLVVLVFGQRVSGCANK